MNIFVSCDCMDLFWFWMSIFTEFKPQVCFLQLNHNLLHAICDSPPKQQQQKKENMKRHKTIWTMDQTKFTELNLWRTDKWIYFFILLSFLFFVGCCCHFCYFSPSICESFFINNSKTNVSDWRSHRLTVYKFPAQD